MWGITQTFGVTSGRRQSVTEWRGSFRKHNPPSSETWRNRNLRLIDCIWKSYTYFQLSGGDCERTGMHECVKKRWTSAEKVTGKVALSKHSCRTCVHRCVFVYTHTRAVRYRPVPKGLRGLSLNKSRAHSYSPESQRLSVHIISQIPKLSLKIKMYSAFFLRSSVAAFFCAPVGLSVPPALCAEKGIPVDCACY